MVFSLSVWLKDLFRPKVYSVRVILFENNKLKDFHTYDSYRQTSLMKAIEELWKVPENTPYWFECETIEECSCWKCREPPYLVVTCYKENPNSPASKVLMNMPARYRNKFLGQEIPLVPESVGNQVWPPLAVRFRLLDA